MTINMMTNSDTRVKTMKHYKVTKPVRKQQKENWWRLFCVWSVVVLFGSMLSACASTPEAEPHTQTHQMTLSHHEFEAWNFTPREKDRIEIVNRSDISHSIYVTYPDGTIINLGVQTPGETVSWQAPATGEYLLQCWIHPIIRAHITVEQFEEMIPSASEVDGG